MRKGLLCLFFLLLALVSCKPNHEIGPEASATIGAQGGTIAVTDASSPIYGVSVEIPSGALEVDTPISIEVTNEEIALPASIPNDMPNIVLKPEGLVFDLPIMITMPFSTEDIPVIVSKEYDGGDLGVLPPISVDAENKKILVYTMHFQTLTQVATEYFEAASGGSESMAKSLSAFNRQDDTFTFDNDLDGLWGTPHDSTVNGIEGGACWGFSFFTQWYYAKKKSTDGALSTRYGRNGKWIVSDAQDSHIRLQELIRNIINGTQINDSDILSNILAAFILSGGKPQALEVDRVGMAGNADYFHAVIVYDVVIINNTDWKLMIYDPNDRKNEFSIVACNKRIPDAFELAEGKYNKLYFLSDMALMTGGSMSAIYQKYTPSRTADVSYDDGSAEMNCATLSDTPGGQIGVVFVSPQYPAKISSASFFVTDSGIPTAEFAINVYDAPDGFIDMSSPLLTKIMKGNAATANTWVSFDLSNEGLLVMNDYCITMEWLTATGTATPFCAQFLGADTNSGGKRHTWWLFPGTEWRRAETVGSGDKNAMIRARVLY